MTYDQTKVAFVDTETTGLDPETDHVWEIAVIVDGEEHVWQQQLPGLDFPDFGPDWSVVSDWVLENTRIKQDYNHIAAYDPSVSIDMFVNLVRGRHIVGACPWFDSERLHRVSLAHNESRDLPWHYHLIDVENLAIGYLTGLREGMILEGYPQDVADRDAPVPGLPWSSTELSLALDVDPAQFEPKHSALADARWAKALYEAIMGDPS